MLVPLVPSHWLFLQKLENLQFSQIPLMKTKYEFQYIMQQTLACKRDWLHANSFKSCEYLCNKKKKTPKTSSTVRDTLH